MALLAMLIAASSFAMPFAHAGAGGADAYEARVLRGYFPRRMSAGSDVRAWLLIENTGTATWNAETRVGLSAPGFGPARGASSPFRAAGWVLRDRPTSIGRVAPGQRVWVPVDLHAPAAGGDYAIYLELVQEGLTWFDGSGDDVRAVVTVTSAAPAVPPGTGVDAAGVTHPHIVAEYLRAGGAAALGAPFDNGGGAPVHRWDDRGFIQDFRGGSAGAGAILELDGGARAFAVTGAAWAEYLAWGGVHSFLGYPTGEATADRQEFEGGALGRRPDGTFAPETTPGPGPVIGVPLGIDLGAPITADGTITVDPDLVVATGARWVRVNFILGPWWSITDGTRAHGRTFFETYDAIVDALRARGIGIYGLINTEALALDAEPLRGFARSADAIAYTDAFAAMAEQIVARYRDRVVAFEFVNEPNDWAGGTTSRVHPSWMARILARTYERVKLDHAGDPTFERVTLVSGAIFTHPQAFGDDYIRAVYEAGRRSHGWDAIRARAGRYPLDGIGLHIYDAEDPRDRPADVAPVYGAHIDAIDRAVRALDPESASKSIWLSEFGWRSDSGEQFQAEMLEVGLAAVRADPRIALSIAFTLRDFPGGLFGILREDDSPKPALARFRDAVTR